MNITSTSRFTYTKMTNTDLLEQKWLVQTGLLERIESQAVVLQDWGVKSLSLKL